LPLPVAPEQLFCTPRYPELIEALKACEFKSLLREVEAEAANGRTPGVQQADLFCLGRTNPKRALYPEMP
jgi:hypothetical protein